MKNAIVLCAGKGTRMHSELPKGAFIVIDKPMVVHTVDALKKAGVDNIVVVVGHLREAIEDILKDRDVLFAVQEKQNGTASAALSAESKLKDFDGETIILPGDMPLVNSELIDELFESHKNMASDLTVLSGIVDNPFGYGRIIRDDNGIFTEIVEENDATPKQKSCCEINSGLIICSNKLLFNELKKIDNKNFKNEYYLTDIVSIMKRDGYRVNAHVCGDSSIIIGVNDRYALSKAERILANRIKKNLMLSGVTIRYPESVMIGEDVEIGPDTEIEPNTTILGKTIIGSHSIIGPNTEIDSSIIGSNVIVKHSLVSDTKIGDNTTVGPFAHLRNGASIGPNNRIGNFVEVKNSSTGSLTKASHLAYIGDATIGNNVNFGCGAITVNYDGKNKWKTEIGNNAFIGSNSNLIAPIKIEDGAFVACGSTINHNVPEGALVIARATEVVKEGYAEKLRKRALLKSAQNDKNKS